MTSDELIYRHRLRLFARAGEVGYRGASGGGASGGRSPVGRGRSATWS